MINVKGAVEYDYGPSNCRWADKLQQTANRSNAKILTVVQGVGRNKITRSGTIGEWARFLRETTGRDAWTTEQLKQCLKSMKLDEIVSAYYGEFLWSAPDPIVNYLESERNRWRKKYDEAIEESDLRILEEASFGHA